VPLARLQSAETWVREHKAFHLLIHLQREAQELEPLRARSAVNPQRASVRPSIRSAPALGRQSAARQRRAVNPIRSGRSSTTSTLA
jgi:hypothetical protein